MVSNIYNTMQTYERHTDPMQSDPQKQTDRRRETPDTVDQKISPVVVLPTSWLPPDKVSESKSGQFVGSD